MIQYENVTKVFGQGAEEVLALTDVTLEVGKGQFVVFLGPSGCGKTTLLRLTNRLIPLTRGTITVNGHDIMTMNAVKLRRSMGYAIQAIGLFPNKTVYGNIASVPRLLGWKEETIRERAEQLMNMLRLDPDKLLERYPVELSGGQQQRVGVARCLAADPDILLMDEPFGAIDPINREEIQDEFLRVQEKIKKTIVFVTHDIHEAIKMGDKIAIFQEGKLIQYDTPETLLTRPKNDYIADFVGADRTIKVLGLLRAKDALNKKPGNVLQGDQDAREALKMLQEKGITGGIVLDNHRPIGHVAIDVLKEKAGPLKDIAQAYDHFVKPYDTLKDIVSGMLMQNLRVLPVVNDRGELLGTVSMDAIQKSIMTIYKDEEGEAGI